MLIYAYSTNAELHHTLSLNYILNKAKKQKDNKRNTLGWQEVMLEYLYNKSLIREHVNDF